MARTNIQVFDTGYQNIMDDDNYNVNVQRARGVTAGIADPLMHNKLYRQTSIMVKAMADYIVSQGQDCLDTDLNAITNAFTKALEIHTRKNNGVLVTEAKTAANTADWNTLTESRTYKITGATFAADKHQPVGAVGTGELVVLKNGDDTIAQVYYTNSAAYDKAGAYHRMCIGGTWTDWVYNITNKGGVVTGDFDINGKLTVDTIQVKENLYIGDYNPADQDKQNALTAEALQKLQDQIIAPKQYIYVNSIDGSDENDGTTPNKSVRTLDKAASLIKPNVPHVEILLKCGTTQDEQEYSYHLSKGIVGNGSSNSYIRITLQGWPTNYKKPLLTIDTYEKRTGGTAITNKYIYTTAIFQDFNSINISGVTIDTTVNFEETEKNKQVLLVNCKNINISNTNLTMSNGFIIANTGNCIASLVAFDTRTSSNCFLFASAEAIPTTVKPISGDGNETITVNNSVNNIVQGIPGQYRPGGTNMEYLHESAYALYPNVNT